MVCYRHQVKIKWRFQIMKTQKIAKQVKVIARIEFKADSRKVCYIVQASNGIEQYTTCLFDGKACSCTCKATTKCYHKTGCEALEAARCEAEENQRCYREMAFSA